MSNLSGRLSDIGGNIIELVELVTKLGLTDDDLQFPERFEKFKDIAKYLQMVENKNIFIRRVTQKELGDKLQKLWEYVKLAEQRDYNDTLLRQTRSKRQSLFGNEESEEPEYQDLISKENTLTKQINNIDNEMRIYED